MNTDKTQVARMPRSYIAAGAVVLVAGVLAFIALGCGEHREDVAATPPDADQSIVVHGSGGTPGTGAVVASMPGGTPGTTGSIVTSDSLPPEVEASSDIELARPGQVIEISALGSDDVTQVSLSDGRGHVQLLADVPGTGEWRATYRLPLRAPDDRVGLSITARNDRNLWRRVWVFVKLDRGQTASVGDTTSTQ